MGVRGFDSSRGEPIQLILYSYSLFEPYCSSAPKVYTDSNGRTSVRFNTLSSLIFTKFNSLFYLERVKHVPPNIGDLLTARALAFWAMDDGCKSEPGFVLCTEGSATPSKLYLVQTLKEKFAEPQKSRAGANSLTLRRGGNWPGAWLRGELAAGFT
jgi:hypothetical protein